MIATDVQGIGETLAQGSKPLSGKQVAFNAEVAVINEALRWFREKSDSDIPSMVFHSNLTSAIARAGHTGARPGQGHTLAIHRMVTFLRRRNRLVAIAWVKGGAGTSGGGKADVLAGGTAVKEGAGFPSPPSLPRAPQAQNLRALQYDQERMACQLSRPLRVTGCDCRKRVISHDARVIFHVALKVYCSMSCLSFGLEERA